MWDTVSFKVYCFLLVTKKTNESWNQMSHSVWCHCWYFVDLNCIIRQHHQYLVPQSSAPHSQPSLTMWFFYIGLTSELVSPHMSDHPIAHLSCLGGLNFPFWLCSFFCLFVLTQQCGHNCISMPELWSTVVHSGAPIFCLDWESSDGGSYSWAANYRGGKPFSCFLG